MLGDVPSAPPTDLAAPVIPVLGGPTAITSSGGTPFQMNGLFELFFAMLLP